MSVQRDGAIIHLRAPCRLEDAETLTGYLQDGLQRSVDLSQAGDLHAAVLQVLIALRPPLAAPASDPFTSLWLQPLFDPAKPP